MEKEKSRIQLQRKGYKENLHIITSKAGITQFEYDLLFFESACNFLEAIYPIDSEYDAYRNAILKDKMFWNWYRTEWKAFEKTKLAFWYNTRMFPTKENWKAAMQMDVNTQYLESSFHDNYLKILCSTKL